jgi:hypothetical protein
MDGILNEMIKYGQHALLPCLEKLFNIILSSGTYPKIWREGYLITILSLKVSKTILGFDSSKSSILFIIV